LSIAGRIIIVKAPATLGRNGDLEPEIFRTDIGVSRQHCRLERRDGKWLVLALSAAATLLDGRLVPQGDAVTLAPGAHRLVLGDTFELGLSLVSAMATHVEVEPDAGGELDRLLRGGGL
jgi:pSer/pThr/pTyr-binding forkhead associated (FHA) protein